MFNYKEWYEKNKEKQKIWSQKYYQKNKDRISQVHKTWAQKNVDQGGTIWRKYNRWKRIRNPFLDAKYYDKHREQILEQKKIYYRKKEGLMYKPLPDSLTIKQSGIDGLGLFAQEGIAQGTNLGMSHLEIEDKIIRTPLGGFINHSGDANCVKVELRMENEKFNYKKWNLVTLQDIKEGEELTTRYTFYKV